MTQQPHDALVEQVLGNVRVNGGQRVVQQVNGLVLMIAIITMTLATATARDSFIQPNAGLTYVHVHT